MAEAHYVLGEVALAERNADAALACFQRSIALKPAFAQPWAQKARVLEALGRGEQAVAAAEAASRVVNDAYSWDTIGVVFTNAGLHARAAEMYARAVKLGRWTGYWYNYASTLQFLGRFDEARVAYREALKLDRNNDLAWAGLVQITKQTPSRTRSPPHQDRGGGEGRQDQAAQDRTCAGEGA